MCRNRLRSAWVNRRLTNKNRSRNTSLIFCCIALLFRAKRRASLSWDDGRPRPNLGLDLAKRALFRHRCQDPLRQFLEDMEGTKLMGHFSKNLADRFGIERRAIGRDPLEDKGAIRQRRLEAPQKDDDVVMLWIVIEDRREHPFVLPIVDGREHTGGPLIEFISCHVAREGLKRPVQKRTVHLPLRLFSPQPPSNSGGWQRAQRRGDRATDAHWRDGKASRLRLPVVPPVGSPDACNDCREGRHQTDQC